MKPSKSFPVALLYTGLLAGTTDIIAGIMSSWIRSGNFPARIFHYIAGGLLGLDSSMQGGMGIGILGLAIHYFIALSWTLLFFVTIAQTVFFSRNKYWVGFFYGVAVGICMTFVVLPMTALPDVAFDLGNSIISWVILGVFLGVPIAYGASRWLLPDTRAEMS